MQYVIRSSLITEDNFLKLLPGLMAFNNKNRFPLYIGLNLPAKSEVEPSNTHISNRNICSVTSTNSYVSILSHGGLTHAPESSMTMFLFCKPRRKFISDQKFYSPST